VGLTLALPSASYGILGVGDTVFDPANHVENITTAINTGQALINQATQIENQVLMIYHQLANLAQLAQAVLSGRYRDVMTRLRLLQRLHQRFKGLIYQVEAVKRQFEALYRQTKPALGEEREAIAITWNGERMNAAEDAMVGQSLIEQLEADVLTLDAVHHDAIRAVGNLQALTAGNELKVLNVEQLMRLEQILAASQRAVAVEMAQRAAIDETARATDDYLWDDATTVTAVGGHSTFPDLY
jgi:P-type conjugative transfer protein TrbJ